MENWREGEKNLNINEHQPTQKQSFPHIFSVSLSGKYNTLNTFIIEETLFVDDVLW